VITLVNRKNPDMVSVRLTKTTMDKVKDCVIAGGFFNTSEWLRVAIRDKITIDEAKLRINEEK